MLTIGELASYAGVTVRAVRHYHARGLLPEPERDHSGYRRYGAGAVVELLRIRTLAEAGVPLARVRELLQADEEEFAAAIVDIDERLRAEMRERQRHRERIARLAAGDSLALPREVVTYLDRLRALGIDERIVQVERDNWIPLAARSPERVPEWMARKREQIADPQIIDFYVTLSGVLARAPARAPGRAPDRATDRATDRGSDRAEDRALDRAEDDPRLAELADKLAACVTQLADEQGESQVDDTGIEPLLAELLDAHVYETLPPTRRLIELLTKRSWTGWTKLERVHVNPVRRAAGTG
ncbi:MerR family transcriptional regulator [Streptomyces sp. NPDC020607]|uniref:MerR family transcriptional regulator n=1 Tax=Streptomyces sp. NPDC020607 TaxID=3365082 RepID=UPI00379C8C32